MLLVSKNHQIIIDNILDRLECFQEKQKLATEVEHDESQYQQRNSLHYYGRHGSRMEKSIMMLFIHARM